MPEELEDDVPVYFSPEDEGVEVPQFDRKSLLEDEPPREWHPYMPAVTLEQASIEAKALDESRFKPPNARGKGKAPAKEEKKKEEKKKNWITGSLTRLPRLQEPEEKVEVELFADDGERRPEVQETIRLKKREDVARRSRVLLLLGAVNFFAMGFWCGSFLFPNRRVITSLYESGGSPLAINPTSSNSIADVVAKVHTAVVNVDVRQGYTPPPVSGSVQSPYRPVQGFFHRHYHGGGGGGYYSGEQSQATGVIVSNDGYILTNNHVLGANSNIRVTLSDNRDYQASIVGRDSYTDLAVLKIDASNVPVARLGEISNVRTGDWVVAIGSPIGYDHSVTVGIISAM
ncbi:MAG: S1C family serine protease, partial [Cyanobacteria bacterium]|nr:S1C family serine protease [Cyanobacteriota bacterium]